MEGSVVSRIQPARSTPTVLSPREISPLHTRPLHEHDADSTPFYQLGITLYRNKWRLLGLAILGGVVAGLAGYARPVLYEASTQVVVDAPRNPAAGQVAQDTLDSTMDDHLTRLMSQAQLRRVLTILDREDRASGAPAEAGQGPGIVDLLRGLVGRGDSGQVAGEAAGGPDAIEPAALKALRKSVRVGQELRSRVITIGVTNQDPVRAAHVANTFAQSYIDDLRDHRRVSDQRELASIEQSLPKAQKDLSDATNELDTYRLTHGASDQAGADQDAREIAQLRRQISLSEAEFSANEARLARAKEMRGNGASLAELVEATGSARLAELAARVAAGEDLQDLVNQELDDALGRMEADLGIYRAQLASLQERRGALETAATASAGRLADLRARELQVNVVSQRYNDLLTRQQELIERIATPSSGISVLSTAWPPNAPKTLSPLFIVPPGMILFGLMGAVWMVLRRGLDRSLRGEAEAEEALGVPCIGLLPRVRRPGAKRLSRLCSNQPATVYGRAVSSTLMSLAPSDGKLRLPHIVFVTSSLRNEGKSELAWSLALSAAQWGRRALVIDLDQHGSALTNEFRHDFGSQTTANSITSFSKGQCVLGEAVEEMPEIGIDLMHGPASGQLAALLSSVDATDLMIQLRAGYDFVVIDGPTTIDGPEARMLAGWADAVLFAVGWATTSRELARSALERLGHNRNMRDQGLAPVGSVLMHVNPKRHAAYGFRDSGDLLMVKP